MRSLRGVGTKSRPWFGEGVVGFVEGRPTGHGVGESAGWYQIIFSGELGLWRQVGRERMMSLGGLLRPQEEGDEPEVNWPEREWGREAMEPGSQGTESKALRLCFF